MAFYKDFEKKTRQEKRDAAFARGGYEDEGSGYGKSRSFRRDGESRGYQRRDDDSQRRYGRQGDEQPRRFGDDNPKKRYLNGKNGYGEHMPRNQKKDDGKPSYERSRFEKKADKPAPRPVNRYEEKRVHWLK